VLKSIKELSIQDENFDDLDVSGKLSKDKKFIKIFESCHRAMNWASDFNI
jgi:hypothetical protein